MTAVRYTVTLPLRDNEGETVITAHERLRERLLDIAGGYSSTSINGAWRADDGTVYHDTSIRYECIAHERVRAGILAAAADACAAARQECVLVTHEPTTATFV